MLKSILFKYFWEFTHRDPILKIIMNEGQLKIFIYKGLNLDHDVIAGSFHYNIDNEPLYECVKEIIYSYRFCNKVFMLFI